MNGKYLNMKIEMNSHSTMLTVRPKVWFQLHHNQINGTVPSEACGVTFWDDAQAYEDKVLVADCLRDSTTGIPYVECDCCQICCDHSADECVLLNYGPGHEIDPDFPFFDYPGVHAILSQEFFLNMTEDNEC